MKWPVFYIRLSRIGEIFASLGFDSFNFGYDWLFALLCILVVELRACIRRGDVDYAGRVILSIFKIFPLGHNFFTQTIIYNFKTIISFLILIQLTSALLVCAVLCQKIFTPTLINYALTVL